MSKIAIFYGSTTGTCESLAGTIAGKLGVSNIYSAADLGFGRNGRSVRITDVRLRTYLGVLCSFYSGYRSRLHQPASD